MSGEWTNATRWRPHPTLTQLLVFLYLYLGSCDPDRTSALVRRRWDIE